MLFTLVQTDIEWAAPERNRSDMERVIQAAPLSDLYVLPEMWSTGFAVHPEGIAEEEQGESLQWMRVMSRKLDAAMAGSIATHCADGTYRNRFYFVTPDGEAYYDKRHLFTYGGEPEHYTAGERRTVVEWRGVRFMLQVCYDLRFPVFSRNRNDYDCILYVASWPASRIGVWNTLLKARAIENQCYVVGVNRIGSDPRCDYTGHSQVVDAYGRVVAQCPQSEPACISAYIDMDSLNRFRQKFPVLADRDTNICLSPT